VTKMGFIDKIKKTFGIEDKSPELIKLEKELKEDFKLKALKVKYDNKLRDVKEGKKSGLAQFGESIMKASDKTKDYDFFGTTGNKKDYGKDLLK